jgi:hypothetical protein
LGFEFGGIAAGEDGVEGFLVEVGSDVMKLRFVFRDMKVGDWVGAFDVEVDEIGEVEEVEEDEEDEEDEEGEEDAELEVEVGDVLVRVGCDTASVLSCVGIEDAMLGQSAFSIFPSSTVPSTVNELTVTAPHACLTESPVFCKPAVQAVEHGPGSKSARWQPEISAL